MCARVCVCVCKASLTMSSCFLEFEHARVLVCKCVRERESQRESVGVCKRGTAACADSPQRGSGRHRLRPLVASAAWRGLGTGALEPVVLVLPELSCAAG